MSQTSTRHSVIARLTTPSLTPFPSEVIQDVLSSGSGLPYFRRVISVHMLCLDDCFATTTMPQPTEITQFIFGQPLKTKTALSFAEDRGYRSRIGRARSTNRPGRPLGQRLKKRLGRVAEQYLADGLVMRVARLDLLREGVDVAEATLERAAGEDRVDAGGLVGPVGDGDGARNRMRAGQPRPRTVRHVDRC